MCRSRQDRRKNGCAAESQSGRLAANGNVQSEIRPLELTQERLEGIAADMRQVASLPSPLGIVREAYTVPSGLRLQKVSVPFGVVGVIYEARPNVSF